MTLKIQHTSERLKKSHCDQSNHVLVALPRSLAVKAWPDFGYRQTLENRRGKDRPEADSDDYRLTLPNAIGSDARLLFIADDISQFKLLSLMAACVKNLQGKRPQLRLSTHSLAPALAQRVALALVAALSARLEPMPDFRSKSQRPPACQLTLHGGQAVDSRRTLAENAGNALARYLTALPGNQLSPGRYIKRIAALAKAEGWRMRHYDLAALKKMRAGAFLAVAQANPRDAGGIVHLRYTPKNARRRSAVALVGKGICFDTGGMNLKSARYMHGMHEDMAGSAVALGSLLTLSRLRVGFPVDCWLAITENHIGAGAYKQNDVVTALNGTSIEIVHTDAEGRMVLADTLALAARGEPGLLLDYATLTGSCITALGNAYSGVFGNDPALLDQAVRAGRASGERVWAFPHDVDFDEELESKIADIKQCTLEGGPDHILAARFLDRFVPKKLPWLHVDLAAGNRKGGLAHIGSDITGFGVHFTVNLLLEQRGLR